MPTYKTTEELKNSIRHLEVTKEVQTKQLKEEFDAFMDNMKPGHILHNTYENVKSSPHINELLMGGIFALTTGYFARKLIIRGSATLIRKVIGLTIQSIITFFITKYSSDLKSLATNLISDFKFKAKPKEVYSTT